MGGCLAKDSGNVHGQANGPTASKVSSTGGAAGVRAASRSLSVP